MRPLLFSLLLALFSFSTLAAEHHRYWVFFEDKGIPAGQEPIALRHAQASLSERSLVRRARNCSAIVTPGDVRVNEAYLRQVIATGAVIRRSSKWLNAVSVEATPKILRQLKSLRCVREVRPFSRKASLEPQRSRQPSGLLDDPDYGPSFHQYNISRIPELHARGLSGEGVLVTILDTGFQLEHEVFDSLDVLSRYDFIFGDTIVANEEGQDSSSQHWHGTLVLSVAGGYQDGQLIAPAFGATYLLAKTEWVEDETPSEEDNYVAALEWADSIGTDITSSSLGYTDWYETSDMDGQTAVTTLAVLEAMRRGILVVTAAGNHRQDDWGTIVAPSDADSILAVAAVDSLLNIADFSSPGPTADGRTKPDIAAHGVHTYGASSAPGNWYLRASGTSLAAPIIAGIAALVMEANPAWTAQQVREAMLMSASQADEPDNDYGHGLADAAGAADYIFSTVPRIPDPFADSFSVLRAYPNPVNGSGIIQLALTRQMHGNLRLFDVRGREVMRWERDVWQRGESRVGFTADNLASGSYFASFEGDRTSVMRRIVILK